MKINFIIALLIFSVSSQSVSNFNDAFLEDVIDITQLEFSDGSFYQGQVSECLLDLIVISCMHGKGVYTFKTGSKYTGKFSNNKLF